MRIVIGLALLLSLFVAAALWQEGYIGRLRSERNAGPSADEPAEKGWGTVVLGRPSGAEPVARIGALYDEPVRSIQRAKIQRRREAGFGSEDDIGCAGAACANRANDEIVNAVIVEVARG